MILESFSAGYWVVPQIEVTTYGGNRAIVSEDLFWELAFLTGDEPIGSTGGTHFRIHPESAIRDDMIAIPKDRHGSRDGDALLISKRNGREVFSMDAFPPFSETE